MNEIKKTPALRLEVRIPGGGRTGAGHFGRLGPEVEKVPIWNLAGVFGFQLCL